MATGCVPPRRRLARERREASPRGDPRAPARTLGTVRHSQQLRLFCLFYTFLEKGAWKTFAIYPHTDRKAPRSRQGGREPSVSYGYRRGGFHVP